MKFIKRYRYVFVLIGIALFFLIRINVRITSKAENLVNNTKSAVHKNFSKKPALFSEHLDLRLTSPLNDIKSPYRQPGGRLIQTKSGIVKRGLSSNVRTGDFKLIGNSQTVSGHEFITLDWDSVPDISDGYVVERTTDGVRWETPPTNYGKRVKILNVHPDDGDFLKSWMDQIDPNTGQPVSMGLIDVFKVNIAQFNSNPDQYLKDSSGKYIYDGIYFGSSDANNAQDISLSAIPAVKAFGRTGRSLIFGHDTIMSNVHDGFNQFASDIGIKLLPRIDDWTHINDDRVGSPIVRFTSETNDGYLNKYPYLLDPTVNYNIQPSHDGGQFYLYNGHGKKWMEYVPPFYIVGQPGNPMAAVHYLDEFGNRTLNSAGAIGDNNAYLITKNNYSLIQTGHTTGACTPDEAKVIANMVYYTSTLNTTTHGEDHTVRDSMAPDIPEVSNSSVVNDLVDLTINTNDKGIDYYYQVKAKTEQNTKISDKIKISITSGLKGYIYQVDDNPNGVVPVNRDPITNEVLNINLIPYSPTDNQARLSFNRIDADKYLHVVAVDKANNVSGIKTIRLSDYLWWKYENGDLSIYPHQINSASDSIGMTTDPGTGETYNLWPWDRFKNLITKVVISPGVSIIGGAEGLFADFNMLATIQGLTNMNTQQMTSMHYMFNRCGSLKRIDLSSFNTSNVTKMSGSFHLNFNLEEINFGSNFVTDRVTSFKQLFEGCKSLRSIDLTNFRTQNATSMEAMFNSCESLTALELSGFDTTNVEMMGWMFENCKSLKKIDVSHFNTSSLKKTFRMFRDCISLTELDLSSFNTSQIGDERGDNPNTSLRMMFYNTPALWKLTLGPNTNLNSVIGSVNLGNPTAGTTINDLSIVSPTYYATENRWREVGVGTTHNPAGNTKMAADIINESSHRNDVRTYVWDQIGTQTLNTSNYIDFGTHLGAIRKHIYTSNYQTMSMTDNRNARSGKTWQVTGAMTKPLTLTSNNSKRILGDPLYFVNSTTGVETNIKPVAQALLTGISGSGYFEANSYRWKLKYQASSKDIPQAGSYKGEVTYTLVNIP